MVFYIVSPLAIVGLKNQMVINNMVVSLLLVENLLHLVVRVNIPCQIIYQMFTNVIQ